jgi:hypothetical protein
MAWQASVARVDPLQRSARVWLWQDGPVGFVSVLDPHGVVHQVSEELEADQDWAWQLPVAALAPLHAALGSHLGIVDSPEALRRDYNAERARVDTLLNAVVTGALVSGGA